VDFSWGKNIMNIIAWLCISMCFSSIHKFFPSQNWKLIYSFESLSLKPMHDNGIAYLTVLAPRCRFKLPESLTLPSQILSHKLMRRNCTNVSWPYLIIYLNRTHAGWCEARCGFENGHWKDMYLDEIGLHALNLLTLKGHMLSR
jgi:hypothetical protein